MGDWLLYLRPTMIGPPIINRIAFEIGSANADLQLQRRLVSVNLSRLARETEAAFKGVSAPVSSTLVLGPPPCSA